MDQEYVGIDLHKRRCVMVRMGPLGERLETRRFVSTPTAMAEAVARAGSAPRVVMEATSNWYWAADVLIEGGAELHLAHPLGLNWGHRKVKNDERDAADLADMLRLGRLPEAWIAPPEVRDLREAIRYRAKLVQLRGGLKSQVHAVLSKNALAASRARLWGPNGGQLLAGDGPGRFLPSAGRVAAAPDRRVRRGDHRVEQRSRWLVDDVGYWR